MIAGSAGPALLRLYIERAGDREAFVFAGRQTGAHVTGRAVRSRLERWARQRGCGPVTRYGLVSALSELLRERGVDDASIQRVLGRRQTRSADRLLGPHKRLVSQRLIQAALAAALRSPRAGQAASDRVQDVHIKE